MAILESISKAKFDKTEYQGGEFRVFLKADSGNPIIEIRRDVPAVDLSEYVLKFDRAKIFLEGEDCFNSICSASEKIALIIFWKFLDENIYNSRARKYDDDHILLEFDNQLRKNQRVFKIENWNKDTAKERLSRINSVFCIFDGYEVEENKGSLNFDVKTPEGSIRRVTPNTCDCPEFLERKFNGCCHIDLVNNFRLFRSQLFDLRNRHQA